MVRNHEGKYFRAKGYGGRGNTWVEQDKARMYTKIGYAKQIVSYFAQHYKDFPLPTVEEYLLVYYQKFDVSKEIKEKIEKKKIKEQQQLIKYRELEIERQKKHIEKLSGELNAMLNRTCSR